MDTRAVLAELRSVARDHEGPLVVEAGVDGPVLRCGGCGYRTVGQC